MFKNKFVKQVGPTCGIYSLYNGLVYLNGLDKKNVDSNVLNALNLFSVNSIPNGYTEIGEYFDIQVYLDFIDNSVINKNVPFSKDFTAKIVDLDIGINSINNSGQNCFIIVPTNPKPNFKSNHNAGKNILHWITVYENKRGVEFINPIKRTVFPSNKVSKLRTIWDLKDQNNALNGKHFEWNLYIHKKKNILEHGTKKEIRAKVNDLWNSKKNRLKSVNNSQLISYQKNLNKCILVEKKQMLITS